MRSNVVKFQTLDGLTTYDSVTDWGMLLTHCDEQKPAPKFERVDVPGANGSIDLSTALSGDIPFADRVVELTFFKLCTDHSAAVTQANTIVEKVHGKQLKIQTPDAALDSAWYEGDVEVSQIVFDDRGCEVSVKCTCDPYKYLTTGGSLSMALSTKTQIAQDELVSLSPGDLDALGIEFSGALTGTSTTYDYPAVALQFARTANLFDPNLVNERYKKVASGGSWANSTDVALDGLAVHFSSPTKGNCYRVAFTGTSATSWVNATRPVIPFGTNGSTHLYLIVNSDNITDSGSVTYDGSAKSAGIRYQKVSGILSPIKSNGEVDGGVFVTGTSAAPAVGNSWTNAVIDCGTMAYHDYGQIIVDIVGVTCSYVDVQLVMVEDGTSVSAFIEPAITIESVTLPQPLDSSDTYTSNLAFAHISSSIEAPNFMDWPRDAVHCEMNGMNADGSLSGAWRIQLTVSEWGTTSTTVAAGSKPTYPNVKTKNVGAAVAYQGSVNVVGIDADAQLPTLLARGSNTVDYCTMAGPNSDATDSASMTWPKGVL